MKYRDYFKKLPAASSESQNEISIRQTWQQKAYHGKPLTCTHTISPILYSLGCCPGPGRPCIESKAQCKKQRIAWSKLPCLGAAVSVSQPDSALDWPQKSEADQKWALNNATQSEKLGMYEIYDLSAESWPRCLEAWVEQSLRGSFKATLIQRSRWWSLFPLESLHRCPSNIKFCCRAIGSGACSNFNPDQRVSWSSSTKIIAWGRTKLE